MGAVLKVYVDKQNRRLVASASSAGIVGLPAFRQGETLSLQLYFLDNDGATVKTPFPAYYHPTATIKVGLCAGTPTGGTDTLLAYQDAFSSITNGFAADLNLNTLAIDDALAGIASRTCTFEIELTESGGTPVKFIQEPVLLQAAVIDPASAVPTPVSEYPTRAEANAAYVKKIGNAGERLILVSDDGTKAGEIFWGDDGAFHAASIEPWPPTA